mmetsp:Transcript_2539/g.9027  ORF Transcript_2539/g.9027 Transcript_2539/m.9027 type:complete len:249 (-) Transcript_2539:585-1331(-)
MMPVTMSSIVRRAESTSKSSSSSSSAPVTAISGATATATASSWPSCSSSSSSLSSALCRESASERFLRHGGVGALDQVGARLSRSVLFCMAFEKDFTSCALLLLFGRWTQAGGGGNTNGFSGSPSFAAAGTHGSGAGAGLEDTSCCMLCFCCSTMIVFAMRTPPSCSVWRNLVSCLVICGDGASGFLGLTLSESLSKMSSKLPTRTSTVLFSFSCSSSRRNGSLSSSLLRMVGPKTMERLRAFILLTS